MRLLLLDNGLDIVTDQDNKFNFVIDIASGNLDFDQICTWISKNIK